MVDTVKFSLRGRVVEVTRTLLAEYPNTVLAVAAETRWRRGGGEGTEEEDGGAAPIFFDRNPDLFHHVLDYMCNKGKVFLPQTVAKEALLQELDYYGFENVRAGRILADWPLPSKKATKHPWVAIRDKMQAQVDRCEKELFSSSRTFRVTRSRLQHSKFAKECFVEYACEKKKSDECGDRYECTRVALQKGISLEFTLLDEFLEAAGLKSDGYDPVRADTVVVKPLPWCDL